MEKLKKIKKFVKKHDNIVVIILIFFSFYGINIATTISNNDELWNFQNVYKLYKEINVITTPLFFVIGKILFEILGANFLTFRIYNLIIVVAIYFITYLLLKELKFSKKMSISLTLFFMIISGYYFLLMQANYNTMALLYCLMGVLIYIKKYKYNPIIQGIVLFLIFITKQNIGIYYAIGLFSCELLSKNKVDKKLKNIIIQFGTFLIYTIILLLYFYKSNILYDFFNFSFLGIREFSSKNISISIPNIISILIFIIFNIFMTIILFKKKNTNIIMKERLIILNCFSISLTLISIPIFNAAHVYIGIYLLIILYIYQIIGILKQIGINIKPKPKFTYLILISISILAISISSYLFVKWLVYICDEDYFFNKTEPFYGGIIKNDSKLSIENITKYIQDNSSNVIILSDQAALYMVPLKRNNGIFDLPFRGNLGKDGENGLIEKIKELQNTEILICKKEEKMQWQESKLAREYIINNLEKIGEIEEFYIYDKK